MMEAEVGLTKINGEKKSHDESQLHDPLMMSESNTGPTGSLTEVTSFSERPSTKDSDMSDNTYGNETSVPLVSAAAVDPEAGGTRAASVEHQPKPLHTLASPSTETCPVHHGTQSFTSINRSQDRHKTTTPTDEEDLCAAVLLACLFCHPLDCLLASVRGLHLCSLSVCSWLCGCEASTLQPLLDPTLHCHICGGLGTRCVMCDCPVSDICLQATECLDLAMEVSQMLYH